MLPCTWGCTGSREGTQPGELTLAKHRDIAFPATACWTAELEGFGRELLLLRAWMDTVVSWWWATALPITCFVYLFLTISSLFNCPHLNLRVSPPYPHPTKGGINKQLCDAELSARLKDKKSKKVKQAKKIHARKKGRSVRTHYLLVTN